METSNISKIYHWVVSNFFEEIFTSEGDILSKASKNHTSSKIDEVRLSFKSGKSLLLKESDILNTIVDDSTIRVEYKKKNDETKHLVLTTSKENIKKEETSMKENKEISYKKDLYGQKRKIATFLGNNPKIKAYLDEMGDKPLGIVMKNSEGEISEYLYISLAKALKNDMNVGTIDCDDCEVVNFDVPWDGGAKVLVIYDENDTLLLFPYLKTTFSSMTAILNFSSLKDVLKMSSPEEVRKEQQVESEIEELDTPIVEEKEITQEESIETSTVEEEVKKEKDEEDEDDDDTIGECYRRIAKYMKKSQISGINFWTDKNDKIHCDITLETIFND